MVDPHDLGQVSPAADPPRDSGLAVHRFAYRISGLTVTSAIELPSAYCVCGPDVVAEVTISAGPNPKNLESPEVVGTDWEMDATHFLLHVPDIGHFLIQNGSLIQVDMLPSAAAGDVQLYLLGTCFAILLQQRGCVVLHASAVVVGDHAVLFCGPSGAGKSTLAAMLCKRGFALLNDDTCCVVPGADGRMAVSGDGRMLKLWARSLDELELRETQGPPVRHDTDKYYLSPGQSELRPLPVAAIYWLQQGPLNSRPTITPLSPLESLTVLRENAYRPALIPLMGLESDYFRVSIALNRQATVSVLRRPMDFSQLELLMSMLEQDWQGHGLMSSGYARHSLTYLQRTEAKICRIP